MTAELQRVDRTPNLPAVPHRDTVHDIVRDQIVHEIGADRLDALHQLLDAPAFNEVLHWLSSAKRAAVVTKQGYADDLTKIAAWATAHFDRRPLPLLQIMTPDAITVWSTFTRAQGMAVRTHRRMLSALSSLFTYAGRHGWAVSNPVSFEDHARPVGTSDNGRPVGATRVLRDGETTELFAACQTAEERLVFELLYLQGMRETEVVKIDAEHIDRNYSPAITKIERKRGQWVERQLLPSTERHLDEHLDGRASGPVLVDPKTGTRRTRHQIIDLTRRLARRAKIPNPGTVTPHVLRATAITELLDDGVPVQEVQQWAGHASSKTTQAYWERRNSVQRDAALTTQLAERLKNTAPGSTSGGPV